MACLKGSHGEVKVECRQQGVGGPAFIRVWGGMLWGSRVKARLVNSDQKEQDFGKLRGGWVAGSLT